MITDIWCEKWEPKTIDDMILNPLVKEQLKKAMVELPNLLISGPPGVGKGTFFNILRRTVNPDCIRINCSDETSVDNVRTKIKSFATGMGTSPLKIVYLNEADFLSTAALAALRDLIEQVYGMTRFIFLVNNDTFPACYDQDVLRAIKSRLQPIRLDNPPAPEIFKHVMKMLTKEGVKVHDKKVVVDVVKALYPDIRGIINTLQLNTTNKELKTVTVIGNNDTYAEVLAAMKAKDPNKIREVLRSNAVRYPDLYNFLYENIGDFKDIGNAIILIGEALYRDATISIKEIGFLRMVMLMIRDKVV